MTPTDVGLLYHVAPEMLDATEYGPPVDMWSIGVVMFVMYVAPVTVRCLSILRGSYLFRLIANIKRVAQNGRVSPVRW